jgi:subtilisin family serine protease
MKKLLSSIIVLIFVMSAAGQTKMNFSLNKKLQNPSRLHDEIAVFIKGDVEKIKIQVQQLGGVFKYSAGDIVAVRMPLVGVPLLASKDFVTRIECNDMKLEHLCDTMAINNNIWPVHAGFSPLMQPYDGTGVVMGIIDEGIDLTHQDFMDINGNTRIKFLWDQKISNDPGGITPLPYGYGTEWNSVAIDNGSASAHQDGPYGHGSIVSGIAAGNGLAVNNYKGAAPGSDIIFVSPDLNVSDDVFLASITDAIDYIFKKASAMGKPAVINISLGTYFGSHDGQDLQAQAIGNLIADTVGRTVVCAIGNAGVARLHMGYNVPADTALTWITASGSPFCDSYIEIYGDTADMHTIEFSAGADDNINFSYRGGTPFSTVPALFGPPFSIDVFNGSNRIGVVQGQASIIGSTFQLIYCIEPDTANYLWRVMTRGSGRVDAWSFQFYQGALPSASIMPEIAKYIEPDTTENMVSSFTCRDEVITVGSYTNRGYYSDVHSIVHFYPASAPPGKLSGFSSRGPTRDGRIKPDITASGENIIGTGYDPRVNALLNSSYDYLVAAGGRHIVDGGTSMASPIVAGTAAMYLQKNPTHNYQQVKNAILNCAKTDSWTGTNLPNSLWGHGKVDAFATLTGCIAGINETNVPEGTITLYPNPAAETTTVYYSLSQKSQKYFIQLSDVLGKKLMQVPLENSTGNVSIPVQNLSGGIYFCSLYAGNNLVDTKKLVVK